MEITLEIANDAAQWDNLLARASYRTIFHTWEWLKIVEKHTKTKLYPIIGFKGTNPVGIFPIFYQKKGPFRLIFSPPSGAGVLYLGPLIIDYENMKQGKRESTLFEFLKAADKFIFSDLKGSFARIRSSPGLFDSRPFLWNRYEVEPLYTFIIDLTKNLDAIWESFDRKLRVNIDKSSREGVSIEEGSIEDLDFLHSSLDKRLKEQGFASNIPQLYLHDIFKSFYPQNLKIFIAKHKGEKVGGSVLIRYNDIISLWIGIPKITLKGIYPNDLLQWETIKWAKKNGFRYYELMDAGDDMRLSTYKSQFNPDLSIWFSFIKYSSKTVLIAEKSYRLANKKLFLLRGLGSTK